MAKAISIDSGSLLCGSPIIVAVKSETASSKATFHRVKLLVNVALSTDYKYEKYLISTPAGDDEIIFIDISTVLISVASKFTYECLTADRTYPYIIYTLTAYDEYMIDGILYEKVGERIYGDTLYALMGEFTDVERYLAKTSKTIQHFSRKPSIGEVCATDELLLYPLPLDNPAGVGTVISAGPTVKVNPLSTLSGLQTFYGHSVYVIPSSKARIQFQFVNKLGVVESISAENRESLSYETSIETDVVSAPGGFRPNRRILSRRGPKQQVYEFSSGPVDLDWADWWVNEFLDCKKGTWIKLDKNWLPCEVVSDDTIAVYDKTSSEICSVNFSVRLALSGGFRNRV